MNNKFNRSEKEKEKQRQKELEKERQRILEQKREYQKEMHKLFDANPTPQRKLEKIENYVSFSNWVLKGNPNNNSIKNVYFFIKNEAVNIAFSLSNTPQIKKEDQYKIDYLIKTFTAELQQSRWEMKYMNYKLYYDFLDYYFIKVINPSKSDLKTTIVCKDLLELLISLGNLDDTSKKRLEYFDKKIKELKAKEIELKKKEIEDKVNNEDVRENLVEGIIEDINKVNECLDEIKNEEEEEEEDDDDDNQVYIPKKVDLKLIGLPGLENQFSRNYSFVINDILKNLNLSDKMLKNDNIKETKEVMEAVVFYLEELINKKNSSKVSNKNYSYNNYNYNNNYFK